MNKLVLVGNGFDLAHDYKTGYNHFITWYITNALEASAARSFDDPLLSILKTGAPILSTIGGDAKSYFLHFYQSGDIRPIFGTTTIDYGDNLGIMSIPYRIEIKSTFLKHLLERCNCNNWVDIENYYYKFLKDFLNIDSEVGIPDGLYQLNQDLKYLISKLEDYLSMETSGNPRDLPSYNDVLKRHKIDTFDFVNWDTNEHQEFNLIHILNFNYTKTIEAYVNSPSTICKINYIHGELGSKNNPVVFGFGDELDDDYQRIEKSTTKDFFEHIKSFYYFRTENYYDLIRFIDSDTYQVHILGHSCGLSDRTMLSMIFEHENCVSIKIHYHQKDNGTSDFTEKTQEIARHFKYKLAMRRKIVPYPRCSAMAQIK